MANTIKAVAALMGTAKRIVVFIGSGKAFESGMQTLRDPFTGTSAHHDPDKLEAADAFREDAALI